MKIQEGWLQLAFVLWLFESSMCTHFRGSMISWRILNETSSGLVTIEIFQRHAWRYTYYSPFCTAATILNRSPMLGSGNLVCVSPCPSGLSILGSIRVPCTGYSISEQYAAGEGRFKFTTRMNVSFVATFTGKGWFNLVYSPDVAWSVAVQVQTFKRTNGRFNNAPVVTMLPIYVLRRLKTYVLKINVADNDFDPYRCFISNGTRQCGDLVNNVPGVIVNETSCYLTFTPLISGYYAVALTVQDYERESSPISEYLSQVPIQFVFRVYDSPNPCWSGPIYVGDLEVDSCIYVEANVTFSTRIRLQVQCNNTNVTNLISVNPSGLTNTDITRDPFDPRIFIYFISFTASEEQYGQNLYCFSGVDSIGNQGPSACLRFIVESTPVLLNPLYTNNATRYPIGVVASTTSTWTIMTQEQFIRPTFETYIRFKRWSTDEDVFRLNVVTDRENIVYLSDRLVLTSNVIWTPGEKYYIYFDSGVLALASTCTKPSMPIIDRSFWPFEIPYETSSSTTTSTSTTSISTTLRIRTVPTQRTLLTRTTTTTTTSTTVRWTSISLTLMSTRSTTKKTTPMTTGEIMGIYFSGLLVIVLLGKVVMHQLRVCLLGHLIVRYGLREHLINFNSNSVPSLDEHQYKLRLNRQSMMMKNGSRFHQTDNGLNSCRIGQTTLVQITE